MFGKAGWRCTLDAGGSLGNLDWSVACSHLRATYESPACIVSDSNSTTETSANCIGDNEIEVRAGDTIPGMPRHRLKFNLGLRATDSIRVGAQLAAHSGAYVRGNENNAHAADCVAFFGQRPAARLHGAPPHRRMEVCAGLASMSRRSYRPTTAVACRATPTSSKP